MIISGTDLLSSLTPYAHVLSASSNGLYCSQCFQPSNQLKRCSKCHQISYCSIECQKKDWTYHRQECSYLSKLEDEYDLSRIFLRLISRFQKDNGKQSPSVKRSVGDLLTHENEIRRDRRRCQTFEAIRQHLRKTNIDIKLDDTMLFILFCQLVINSLTIHDPIDLKPIGYGLYLDATCFNHSCRPNCHAIFNGVELTIRSISDHVEDQSSINYIDLLDTYEARQHQLHDNYYFNCQCSRCTDVDPKEVILIEKIRNEEQKMDRFIEENNFTKAYQSSERLCADYELILPTYHAYVSLHHVKNLKLALFLAETIDSSIIEMLMKETCRRLKISMNEHHPLAQQAIQLCEQYRFEVSLRQRSLNY